MAFELFESRIKKSDEPTINIQPTGGMYLNAVAAKHLNEEGAVGVLLYWDASALRMALVPTDKPELVMFALRYTPSGRGASFSARAFAKHIGWTAKKPVIQSATWDGKNKRFTIDLPGEHVSSANSIQRMNQTVRLTKAKTLQDL